MKRILFFSLAAISAISAGNLVMAQSSGAVPAEELSDEGFKPSLPSNWEEGRTGQLQVFNELNSCNAKAAELTAEVGRLKSNIASLSAANLELRNTIQEMANKPAAPAVTVPAETSRILENQAVTYTNIATTQYVAGETAAADKAAATAAATTYAVDATALAERLLAEQKLAAELSRIATEKKVREAIEIFDATIRVSDGALSKIYTRLIELKSAIDNTTETYVNKTSPTSLGSSLLALQKEAQSLTREMYMMLYSIRSGKLLTDFQAEVERILASNPSDPKAAVTDAMNRAIGGVKSGIERMKTDTEQYVAEYGSLGPAVIKEQ